MFLNGWEPKSALPRNVHYTLTHTHAPMWDFCSLCIKSIPMNMNAAHRVTFQHWCVSRIRSTKGYSRWGEKLRSDWPAMGKPRRTRSPFPYTLQPMKIAKSNTFPSAQRDPALRLGDLWKSVCKNHVLIRGHGGGSQTANVIATHTHGMQNALFPCPPAQAQHGNLHYAPHSTLHHSLIQPLLL